MIDCGSCSGDASCTDSGQCVDPTCEPEGDAALCALVRNACGAHRFGDRCNQLRNVDCGACIGELVCGDLGQCVDPACVPSDDAALCAGLRANCGRQQGADNCGQTRIVECGDCTNDRVCSMSGQCIDPACEPELDATLCTDIAASCGTHEVTDRCEQRRTIDCGPPCTLPDAPVGWLGEFEVDDPGYGSARKHHNMYIVDTGSHYLAVWQDDRGDGSGWARTDAILSTRISYDGQVLDPGGHMLFEPSSTTHVIRGLVFDGSEALLVFIEPIDQSMEALQVLRLDGDGRALGELTELDRGDIGQVTADFDGERLLIAYTFASSTELRLVTVDPTTLATQRSTLTEDYPNSLSMAIRDGVPMLGWISWDPETRERTIKVAVLGSDYALMVPGGTAVRQTVGAFLVGPGYLQQRTLEATPTGYALLHDHYNADTRIRHLDAVLFDASGTELDGVLPIHSKPGRTTQNDFFAESAIIDDNWIVTANTDEGCMSVVIDSATSTIREPASLLVGSDEGNRPISYGFQCRRTDCRLVHALGGISPKTRILRYTPTRSPLGDPIHAASAATNQLSTMVAYDGANYLTAWIDIPSDELLNVPETPTIRLRRLAPNGRWLGPAFEVPTTDQPAWGLGVFPYPTGGWLIRWQEEQTEPRLVRTYHFRRLAADGTWAWPAPVALRGLADHVGPAVCGESNCLVSYGRTFQPMRYGVLNGDGDFVVEDIQWPGLANDDNTISVHYERDHFWLEFTTADALEVVSVVAAGAFAGQLGPHHYRAPITSETERSATWLADIGDEVLLLSSTTVEEAGEPRYSLEARTLTATGLSTSFLLADHLDYGQRWIGSITHGDEIHSFFDGYGSGIKEHLFRVRYHRNTGVADPVEPYFDDGWFGTMSVVPGPDGGLMAYNRIDWSVGFGGNRARLHFVGDRSRLLPEGASCTDDGECDSGRCRASQCCNTCPLWKGL